MQTRICIFDLLLFNWLISMIKLFWLLQIYMCIPTEICKFNVVLFSKLNTYINLSIHIIVAFNMHTFTMHIGRIRIFLNNSKQFFDLLLQL